MLNGKNILFVVLCLPVAASAADLRSGYQVYDGGTAEYELSNKEHLICDSCPKIPEYKKPARAVFAGPAFVVEANNKNLSTPANIMDEGSQKKQQSAGPAEITETVYFGLNSSVLTPEAKTKIKTILLAHAGEISKGSVGGYTCRLGSGPYNNALSVKRAKAVKRYLLSLGIRSVDIVGHGKREPTGRQIKYDRRAVVLLIGEK